MGDNVGTHRVYRVPESPGRSSDLAPPNPNHRKRVCPPPIQDGEGGTVQRDTGTLYANPSLWYGPKVILWIKSPSFFLMNNKEEV
jgi:hypothetical protein